MHNFDIARPEHKNTSCVTEWRLKEKQDAQMLGTSMMGQPLMITYGGVQGNTQAPQQMPMMTSGSMSSMGGHQGY